MVASPSCQSSFRVSRGFIEETANLDLQVSSTASNPTSSPNALPTSNPPPLANVSPGGVDLEGEMFDTQYFCRFHVVLKSVDPPVATAWDATPSHNDVRSAFCYNDSLN